MGLIVGYHSPEISTPASRLRGYGFWEVLVFLLNAVLFVLVGLQLPDDPRGAGPLRHRADRARGVDLRRGDRDAAAVGQHHAVLLRAVDRRPQQVARRVGWRQRQIAGWSGLRGSVSLAAALALPFGFPERDLLIFLTLAVIFATLVVQGLTLPYLIRRLGIEDDGVAAREELHARREATAAAIEHLNLLGEEDWTRDDTVGRMLQLYEFRNRRLGQRAGELDLDGDEGDLDERSLRVSADGREVLDAQRRRVIELRNDGAISDEVLHVLERELDLEDQRLEI